MPSIVSHHVANMFGTQNAFQAQQAQALKTQAKTPELLQALKNQKDAELHNLHRSFFDTAQNLPTNLDAKTMAQVFGTLSPKEALLLAQSLNQAYGYHDNMETKDPHTTSHIDDRSNTLPSKPRTPLYPNTEVPSKNKAMPASFATAKNQQAKMAEQSLKQIQNQTQNFVTTMLGGSHTSGNMTEFLGQNTCFEDALMQVMMKIAKQEEKNVSEKIRVLERGHAGLPGLLGDRARDLGGVAGGALGAGLGAYFGGAAGGTTGATVGQDIGERLVGSYTGYNSQESRQIQFEKLKHSMQKLSEMMTCISNILSTMHQTNKNTVANLRG